MSLAKCNVLLPMQKKNAMPMSYTVHISTSAVHCLPGLIPLVRRYVESTKMDGEAAAYINKVLKFVSMKASGESPFAVSIM